MGTNYYIKHKERKVTQPDLHIGKNSAGWEFSFEAHEKNEYYQTPDLKTKQQWFEYMFLNDGNIFNEYNVEISFQELVKIIESTMNRGLKNHYDYLKENHDFESLKYCFKDEGFSFSEGDFS